LLLNLIFVQAMPAEFLGCELRAMSFAQATAKN